MSASSALDLLKSSGVENAERYAPIFEEERAKAVENSQRSKHVPTVLFVCGQNAGRSQLAEALFKLKIKELQADDLAFGFSAGTVPAKALNPIVKEVMEEFKVDTTEHFPKPVTQEVADAADVIVAMGCDTSCPYFKGKKTIHWELPDAKGKDISGIREIRSNVSLLVDDLIKDLGLINPTTT